MINPIVFAEADWKHGAGEHDRSPGSILDDIFKISGWSPVYGVPKGEDDKIVDWCDFAYFKWQRSAGFNPGFNTSFFHVDNTVAFYTYGAERNVNPRRLDTEIELAPGRWTNIMRLHQRHQAMRLWIDRDEIRLRWDVEGRFLAQPGDAILFDWDGKSFADHIGMVRKVDGPVVEVIEGNRTGLNYEGKKVRDSVVLCRYDLRKDKDLRILYGIGRPSFLDYGTQAVR